VSPKPIPGNENEPQRGSAHSPIADFANVINGFQQVQKTLARDWSLEFVDSFWTAIAYCPLVSAVAPDYPYGMDLFTGNSFSRDLLLSSVDETAAADPPSHTITAVAGCLSSADLSRAHPGHFGSVSQTHCAVVRPCRGWLFSVRLFHFQTNWNSC
jgi:hypothetical protein